MKRVSRILNPGLFTKPTAVLPKYNYFTPKRSYARHVPKASRATSALSQRTPIIYALTAAAAAATLAATTIYLTQHQTAHAEAPANQSSTPPRKIRLAEVRQHGRAAESRWVVKGTRVYDITAWIPNHPGGEVILRAVGGVIDSYWDIFSIHKKQDVIDILEQYYIGDLDEVDLVDGKVPQDVVEDPFELDPVRDEGLRRLSERPCNAETPREGLKGFITGNELFCEFCPFPQKVILRQ